MVVDTAALKELRIWGLAARPWGTLTRSLEELGIKLPWMSLYLPAFSANQQILKSY